MANAEVQQLLVRLGLDTSQFTKGIAQAESRMLGLQRQAALMAQASQAVKASRAADAAAHKAATVAGNAELARLRARAGSVQDLARANAAYQSRWSAMETARLDAAERLGAKELSLGQRAYARRAALSQRFWDSERARISATVAMQSRYNDLVNQAPPPRPSLRAGFNKGLKLNRVGDIGTAVVGGGLTFLRNTMLATAAAGVVLEFQFLKVQDAQAAMARTLEGESAPALAKLNQEILELSKIVPLSVTELYRIAEVAGTIGIASGSVAEFTDVVAKMAATTDLGVDAAALGIGRLLNIFGFVDEKGQAVADQANNIASAMLKLSISQASTDQEILLATERFGALATSMGLLPPQILAIASTAAALGQRPEAIGGSIQRIFQIMNKAIATGGKGLNEFARVAGVTSEQFEEMARTDPFTAFTTFLEGFGRLTPEQQSLLFGAGALFPSNVRGAQTLQGLAARVDLLKNAAAAAQTAYEQERLLDEQSAVRFNTLKNNLQLLGNALTRGAVAFGSAFDQELGGAIKRVTQYITENEDKFAEWGEKVAKAIKSIDWQGVKKFAEDFFGVFATGVGATIAILDALGPKLTATLALIGTVNALSGGAIKNVGGLLAGGVGGVLRLLVENRFARGSTPANPLFVSDVGGMLGGALGGGGPVTSFLARFGIIGSLLTGALVVGAIGLWTLAAKTWIELGDNIKIWTADLQKKVLATESFSGGKSLSAIASLTASLNALAADPVKGNILKMFGAGKTETIDAFKSLVSNVLTDPALSPSDRRIGLAQIELLKVAISEAYGANDIDRLVLAGKLDAILKELQQNPITGGGAGSSPYGMGLPGYVVRQGDLQEETNDILNRGFAGTAEGLQGIIDRLPKLKPAHRQGERGKSIESAQHRALQGLDPNDPLYAAKITAYVAALVEHYTKNPIGTPGHTKGFVLGATNKTETALGADLKAALAAGNTAQATIIAEALRDLDSIPGNKLPSSILKLIDQTERAKSTALEMGEKVTGAVRSGAANTNDRIENLTAALRRKRLSVRVVGPRINIRPSSVNVRPVISVRIGARTVTRAIRSTIAYGPAIIYQQPGQIYEGPN